MIRKSKGPTNHKYGIPHMRTEKHFSFVFPEWAVLYVRNVEETGWWVCRWYHRQPSVPRLKLEWCRGTRVERRSGAEDRKRQDTSPIRDSVWRSCTNALHAFKRTTGTLAERDIEPHLVISRRISERKNRGVRRNKWRTRRG